MPIEDSGSRTEAIRVRHSKTQAYTFLPLTEPVGEAILASAFRTARDERTLRSHACTFASSTSYTSWFDVGFLTLA
ncbi:hypothetical protein J2Z31_005939 [Sinorhizobium kostiense]|uniref:Transposase n=1 Tax=Sinorhizobium kostiense TaxID=76747 RepID=A0ABS4R929_9HYPH|nr:hypothetical protein [Sinorhizobium kostiense]